MRFAERKERRSASSTRGTSPRGGVRGHARGRGEPAVDRAGARTGRLLPGRRWRSRRRLVRGGAAARRAAGRRIGRGSGAAERGARRPRRPARARAREAAPPPHDPFAAPPKQSRCPRGLDGGGGSAGAGARGALGHRQGRGRRRRVRGRPVRRTPSRAGSAPTSPRSAAGTLRGDASGFSAPADAIVVLHLEGGRDFPHRLGTVAPSVFGVPLGALSRASFPPDVPTRGCDRGPPVQRRRDPSGPVRDRARDEPGSLALAAAAALDAETSRKRRPTFNVPAADAAHAPLTPSRRSRAAAATEPGARPRWTRRWRPGRPPPSRRRRRRAGGGRGRSPRRAGARPLAGSRGDLVRANLHTPERAACEHVVALLRAMLEARRGERAAHARAVRGGVVPGGRDAATRMGRVAPRRAATRRRVPGWV